MINLHIIPTDKPSRLFKVSDELKLTRKFDFYNGAIYQNIYITNSEEIKKDEFYLGDDNHIYNLCTTVNSNGKKIILTTNEELIEEGIQAIDDEFLEWFVNNPSCEEVEVESNKCLVKRGQCSCSYQDIDCQCLGYKIIIPKEELNLNCFDCNKSLQDCTCMEDTIDMKEESIEEAAERLFPAEWDWKEKESFIEGAEWQAAKMYGEKEIVQIIDNFLLSAMKNEKKLFDIFNEFKKK